MENVDDLVAGCLEGCCSSAGECVWCMAQPLCILDPWKAEQHDQLPQAFLHMATENLKSSDVIKDVKTCYSQTCAG